MGEMSRDLIPKEEERHGEGQPWREAEMLPAADDSARTG